MKKLVLVLFLLTSIMVFSQNKNFIVDNGLINWRYIYEDSTSVSELKSNPRLDFKTDSTGVIKKTNFEDNNLRKFVAEFKIDKKKNKYRVTVYNFIFDMDDAMGAIIAKPITYTIESTFLKSDGTIRKSLVFGYNLTEVLNPHLLKLFTIKKKEKSDW